MALDGAHDQVDGRAVVKRLEGVLRHIQAPIMLTKADAKRSQWTGTGAFFRKLSTPVTKKTTKRRKLQLGEGGVAASESDPPRRDASNELRITKPVNKCFIVLLHEVD